ARNFLPNPSISDSELGLIRRLPRENRPKFFFVPLRGRSGCLVPGFFLLPGFRLGRRLVRAALGLVLLQVRLRRRIEVDCVDQLVGGLRLVCLLIAIQTVEHFYERRDRLDVALTDRLARRPERRREPRELQERVVRAVVDLAPPQNLGDDLARASRGDPLLARDLVIGPALAQARKNTLPPRRLADARQPLVRRRRRVLLCPCLHDCPVFPFCPQQT